MSRSKSKRHGIFIRLPNWVGDVCMALPSLQAVLASGEPVIVCARPWAQDLLAAYPIAGFIPMSGHWRRDRQRVFQWRRAHHIGATRGLLLPDSLSSALVFALAGVASAGYRDDGRSPLLRWPLPKPRAPMHAVQSWYHLTCHALQTWGLAAAGAQCPPPNPAPELNWRATPAHQAQCAALLDALDPSLWDKPATGTPPFVLIAPTAVGLHHGQIKVWQGFAKLSHDLRARGHVVLMAPPAAEQDAARAAAPDALMLPPLGLGAFACLTRAASLVICNDSGVSHLAAAAHARQITLFGVTNPARTGPWSPRAVCLGREGAWPDEATVLEHALAALDAPVLS